MKIVSDTEIGIEQAVHILKQGGIVAHATETCYGLACDLTNPEAVARLFVMKQRPINQPVSALFSSVEEIKKYAHWPRRGQQLSEKYLPGPLTLILCSRGNNTLHITPFPFSIPYPLPPIAVRLSSHPIAQALVKTFGSPLSTTSTNLHGKPETFSVQEILEQFSKQKNQPDLILDSGIIPRSLPSTIVDLSGEGEKIVRQGIVFIS